MDEKSVTKQKLLAAASIEFAKMGYQKARIREISSASGTNLAAVNYHFGSKANLYLNVLEYIFNQTGGENFQARLDHVSTREDYINTMRETIRDFLNSLGQGDLQVIKNKLLYRELNEPSEMYGRVFEMFIQPRLEFMKVMIMKITGIEQENDALYVKLFQLLGTFGFYANGKVVMDKITGSPEFILKNREEIIESTMRIVLP